MTRAITTEGLSPRVRRSILAALVVLVIVSVTSAVFAVRAEGEAEGRASAAQEGRAFAVDVVPSLLSYDFDTAQAHFADVASHLGGEFRGQFEEVGRTVIVPSAVERKVATTAEVVESSVVSADVDNAELLLFVNQSTTTAESPETKLDGSRVRVHVERSDGKWLITELTPV